ITRTSAADAAPTIKRMATPSMDSDRAIDLGFISFLLPAGSTSYRVKRARWKGLRSSRWRHFPPLSGRNASFPPVGNAASIQAGSRYIREIPDPRRSLTQLGSKDASRLFAATGSY